MADFTEETLFDQLKRLLGKRNLTKYYPDDDDQGTNQVLSRYVGNAIAALSRKRQFWVKVSLSFDTATNIIPMPSNIYLLKVVWKDDRSIRFLPIKGTIATAPGCTTRSRLISLPERR